MRTETGVPQQFGYPPGCPRKQTAAGTKCCCKCKCIGHLFYARTEYRESTGSRQQFATGTRIGSCFYGWGSKRTVGSVSGNSHTDDVACRKNKEVSDPAVCRSLSTGRRCLQFVRVCSVRCFSACCVRNLVDNNRYESYLPGTRK